MSTEALASPGQRSLAWLNYFYLLAMMAVIAAILTAAMIMQYAFGELPCPLCLLQRVAMFGVCFGILLQFRNGFSYQNTGISMIFALMLLVVAERQTLLDIYPRPGHEYIGSAVLGLHMPVWSVIVGLLLLLAFAVKLAVIGSDRHLEDVPAKAFPRLGLAATLVGGYVTLLAIINGISVAVQCGVGECHTTGYALFGALPPS